MIRTKSVQILALAGFIPAGKFITLYRSLLPLLALCAASAAWSQALSGVRGSRVPPSPVGGVQQPKPAAATPASAEYRFVAFEIPGVNPGGPYSQGVMGIDNSRMVTGYYYDGSSYHGFAWRDGVLSFLDLPGAADTYVIGANNRGTVIENYDNGIGSGFISGTYSLHNGTWTMLPDPSGNTDNSAYIVNDLGVIVGDAYAPNNVAWIWNPGTKAYSIYAVPGSTQYSTYSGGINDKGQISGQFQDSSGVWHGFLKEGETYTTIDPKNSQWTYAEAINNSGTIAGTWYNLSGWAEGFIRTSDGVFKVVDVPGGFETMIIGINDRGDICGMWVDPKLGLWTPFVAYKR